MFIDANVWEPDLLTNEDNQHFKPQNTYTFCIFLVQKVPICIWYRAHNKSS